MQPLIYWIDQIFSKGWNNAFNQGQEAFLTSIPSNALPIVPLCIVGVVVGATTGKVTFGWLQWQTAPHSTTPPYFVEPTHLPTHTCCQGLSRNFFVNDIPKLGQSRILPASMGNCCPFNNSSILLTSDRPLLSRFKWYPGSYLSDFNSKVLIHHSRLASPARPVCSFKVQFRNTSIRWWMIHPFCVKGNRA